MPDCHLRVSRGASCLTEHRKYNHKFGTQRYKKTVIKSVFHLLLILLFLSGCSERQPRKDVPAPPNPAVLIPAEPQIEALALENRKQFLDALSYWKKTEQTVDLKIASLVVQMKEIADDYVERGVEFYDMKKGHEALLVFLEALRFDPTNETALDYLRNRYEPDEVIHYSVKPNDTFASIAETVYGSETYRFVVAQLSDAGAEQDLSEGLLITLPQLESFYSLPLRNYKKDIRQARSYYKSEEYEKALPVATMILENHPEDEEASFIKNRSLIKIAEKQREGKRFEEAVATLSQVDPFFKNVSPEIEEIQEEQLVFEKTEGKRKNRELLSRGKELFNRGDYLEALHTFLKIDPNSAEAAQAIADTRQKLQIAAEFHFKEGVKFFVEDRLGEAISEWRKTLELAPNHPNALASIEKAQNLLQKIKEIN